MPIPFGALLKPLPTPIPYWDVAPESSASQKANDDEPQIRFGEGPTYSENIWDTVFFNGKKLPGLCKIHGLPTIKFDKKKPGGADGIALTSQGYLPGPIEIEVLLWTADQWSVFQGIASDVWIKPIRGGKARPLDISHPSADLWGVKAIIVEGVSLPEPGPVPQSMIIKIKAFEFQPPTGKTHVSTPKASGKVPVDKRIDRNKNAGGESPGVSETGPTGLKKP